MKSTTSTSSTLGLVEQLEAPFEGREQLDPVAEHEPRMRPEGDDRRQAAPAARAVSEHLTMATVHAVEAPDRDDAFAGGELAPVDERLSQPGERLVGRNEAGRIRLLDGEGPDLEAAQRSAVAAEQHPRSPGRRSRS